MLEDSACATTEPASNIRETPVQAMESSFVQTQGQQFVLDGKPLFVNGVNLYFLMTQSADPELRPVITEVLQESASVGSTVVRASAFADGDGTNFLQKQPGVYEEVFQVRCQFRKFLSILRYISTLNEGVFLIIQGLDFALSEAKKKGIRLILSFVNNWSDFRGRAKYA